MKTNYNKLFVDLYFVTKYFGIKKFIILFFLVVIASILEIFSVAVIIPVVNVMQNPNFLTKYFSFFENTAHLDQIVFVILLLGLVFLIKFLFLMFINFYQFKIVMNLQAQISKKLIQNYINMSYQKYFKISISEITRNVVLEPAMFVMGVVLPVVFLLSEFLLIFGIFLLLIYKTGIQSLSIIVIFIIITYLYFLFTKKRIKDLGFQRENNDEKIITNSREALISIREIKINKTENMFFSFFNLLFDQNSRVLSKFFTYQVAPRLGMEFVVVVFLSASLLILFLKGNSFETIISVLALIGVSAIRLIPSSSKIITSLQNIKFNEVSIQSIIKGLKIQNNKLFNNKNFTFKKIELKKINFYYNKTKIVLKNINLIINKGDRIGITGKTGSGKSTLVDTLSGLLEVRSGKFFIDNKEMKKKLNWEKNLGYVSQKSFLYNNNIRYNISFETNTDNDKEIFRILKLVKLDSFVKTLKHKIDTNLGDNAINISGGQKQRIEIARALYHQPDLLILDEAFSAIDLITEEKIILNIFSQFPKMTIINISHKGPSLKYCNKIFNLDNGVLKKNVGKIN